MIRQHLLWLAGTQAERTAYDTTPLQPPVLWYETDTAAWYFWSGAAWAALGGGGVQLATDAEVAVGASGVVPEAAQLALYRQLNDALQVDTGGNARGAKAVDLQAERSANDEVASGPSAFVSGGRSKASGDHAQASGYGCVASGKGSHAEGYADPYGFLDGFSPMIKASADGAHAEGYAYGEEGQQYTEASGVGSHAEGVQTRASGFGSHTEGNDTQATNSGAHAEGGNTQATGGNSHAEGSSTVAAGTGSHAGGLRSTAEATAYFSHAGGVDSLARFYAEFTRSAGRFANKGDAQCSAVIFRRAVSSHTLNAYYDLFADGYGFTSHPTILISCVWLVRGLVVGATQGAPDFWSYEVAGTLANNQGGVQFWEYSVTPRYESTSNFVIELVSGIGGEELRVRVKRTGGSDYSIRWVAALEILQLSYPV